MFYFHRALPWHKRKETSLNIYGTRFHEMEPAALLQGLRQLYEQAPTPALQAYCCGFLCHVCLDSICHPFVESGAAMLQEQSPGQSEDFLHNQIESALDVILLRYERGALPTDFPLQQTIPKGEALWQEVAAFYRRAIAFFFQEDVPQERLVEVLADSRAVQKALYDPTTLKQLLVARRERKTQRYRLSCYFRSLSEGDLDYANICENEWREGDVVHTESFLTLYERAVQKACAMTQAYLQTDDLSSLFLE